MPSQKCSENWFISLYLLSFSLAFEANFNITQVIVSIFSGGSHNQGQSVHLHGHSFHVLGHGPLPLGAINRSAIMALYREGALSGPSPSPVAKDTIGLPKGGYALVRFKADNPGE